jgi:hypothetical protein
VDEFAQQPSQERRLYFEQAAARLGLSAQMIEKDFWVCWSLRRLFSLGEFRDHLTFKGGTTLSKVYRVIERFSEDLDVAIERDFLGFGGDDDPERGQSGKEQRRRIERLKDACQAAVADRIQPALCEAITRALGDAREWSLSLDPTDPDRQSLLFRYPPAIRGSLSPYLPASVKIELGARSDHFPVENGTVTPYLSEAIPQAISDAQIGVRVLAATRTFWEKATILHMLHHQPEERTIPPRMSRHYYDVFRLSQSPVLEQALGAIELLERVAVFKAVYFKAGRARYEEARPGTLRLMPGERLIGPLTRDYADMRPMFFGEPPRFEHVLASLSELENRINEIKR